MYQGFKLPKVTFRIREGDVVLEEGCSFDEGKWVEKTTDDFANATSNTDLNETVKELNGVIREGLADLMDDICDIINNNNAESASQDVDNVGRGISQNKNINN